WQPHASFHPLLVVSRRWNDLGVDGAAVYATNSAILALPYSTAADIEAGLHMHVPMPCQTRLV
ncbi:hypothetical protein CH063_12523, partial [Colletotrichum higginsianum]